MNYELIAIFLIAFAIIFGGTLLGMYLRTLLSEHHLSADSRDVMKMGTDMLATMVVVHWRLLSREQSKPTVLYVRGR